MNGATRAVRAITGAASGEARSAALVREIDAITEPARLSELQLDAHRKREAAVRLAEQRPTGDPERDAAEDAADDAEAECAAFAKRHAARIERAGQLSRELAQVVREEQQSRFTALALSITGADHAELDAAALALRQLVLERCARWELARQLRDANGFVGGIGGQPRPAAAVSVSGAEIDERVREMRRGLGG